MTVVSCAILDDYQEISGNMANWALLGDRVRMRTFTAPIGDEAALVSTLWEFDVIIVMRERTAFRKPLLQKLPNLRLLVTTGMVNASIDMAAARDLGITVCGTPGSVGPAAELAWGLLLSVMRNIPEESANLKNCGAKWQLSAGRDLQNKTLGVVGLGNLGRRVAGYGLAFKMNVIGLDTCGGLEQLCIDLGIGKASSLDDLLIRSDVVSLHLTQTPETVGMIGTRELKLMGKDAVLINTSRGPLVDEAALCAALTSGELWGAGIDVFDQEPLPFNHPFRRLPNLVATPHLGFVTQETYKIYFSGAVEALQAWLENRPMRVLNAL